MSTIAYNANQDLDLDGKLMVSIGGEPIAFATSAKLNTTTDMIDTTSQMSGDWKEEVPGVKSFTVSSEALLSRKTGAVSGEVDISNWKINPKAQVTLNTLTYSMLYTDRLGELHWLWASQFTHGALKGHKRAVYRQMRGEQKDIYMHYMDSASNAPIVTGKQIGRAHV